MSEETAEDELVFDEDLDDPETEAPAPESDPLPPAAEAESAAATQASVDALAAVKESWVELAKVQGAPFADFDSIGMTGVGPEDRQQFIAAAKQSHTSKVSELEKMGFVYDPGRNTQLDAEEAAAAAAWGEPIAGSDKSLKREEAVTEKVNAAVRAGDTRGTIRTLLAEGGMAEMFKKIPGART